MTSYSSTRTPPPRLLVLPSSPSLIHLIGDFALIDPIEVGTAPGTWRCADALRLLETGRRPDFVVFSDQLVSSEDAPIPVQRSGGSTFLSGFEVMVHARFGYRVGVWSRAGLVSPEGSQPILAALASYLDDCASLDGWTARNLQVHRQREQRVVAAEAEIRRLQDAALCAWFTHRLTPDAALRRILERSESAMKQLRAA